MGGSELVQYVAQGQVSAADEINPITEGYDLMIQSLLDNLVDDSILKKYESTPNAYGLGMYLYIVRDYAVLRPRDKYLEVKRLKAASTVKDIEAFEDEIMPSLNQKELIGLYFLAHVNSTEAEMRVFSNPVPDLSLAAIKEQIKDLISPESMPIIANVAGRMKKPRKEVICFRCNQKGHTAPKCPATAPATAPAQTKNSEKNNESRADPVEAWSVALFSSVDSQDVNSYWLDSGATIHVCNNRSHFSTLEACHLELQGIGTGMIPVCGIGSVEFRSGQKTLRLDNVHYVPQAKKNLVSIPAATAKGA